MYQIVKLTFPFADNLDKRKPRPALVVSPSFGPYNQLIVAYITKNINDPLETDIMLDINDVDFHVTGLHHASLIKLHRLVTVTPSKIVTVGVLPNLRISEVKKKLMKVFQLK